MKITNSSFLLWQFISLVVCTNSCAQIPSEIIAKDDPFPVPDFLDSISQIIISTSEEIEAYTFEQNTRGETQLASPAHALQGFKILSKNEHLTGVLADSVKKSIIQHNLYDHSGYLPRCGFDPDLGFVFKKGNHKLTILLMVKTDCNVVQFFKGDSLAYVKLLTVNSGRTAFVSYAKQLFPETYRSVPTLFPRREIPEDNITPINPTTLTPPPPDRPDGSVAIPNNAVTASPTMANPVSPALPPSPTSATKYHEVKKKDTLMKISRKAKLDVTEIQRLNPQITNWGIIHPGDKIRISE